MSKFQRQIQTLHKGLTNNLPNSAPGGLGTAPSAIENEYVKFNIQIGNPKHPATLEPMPMMQWQVRFFDEMVIAREKRKGLAPLKVHENKSRQIGATDNGQRFFAFHGSGEFEQRSRHWYIGKKIINIAGTREKTAKKIQTRLRALFNNIENTIADNGTDLWFKLKNGTEYEAMPSNSEAIRGDTKIGAIAVDEAAHFKLVDDSEVIDAIIPIVDTNLADLFLRSTPNGRRGFFYNIDVTENDFIKLKFPIWVAEQIAGIGLYTHEQIDLALARKDIDVEQEYLNKYTTTRSSYYGDEFTQGEHEEEDLSRY